MIGNPRVLSQMKVPTVLYLIFLVYILCTVNETKVGSSSARFGGVIAAYNKVPEIARIICSTNIINGISLPYYAPLTILQFLRSTNIHQYLNIGSISVFIERLSVNKCKKTEIFSFAEFEKELKNFAYDKAVSIFFKILNCGSIRFYKKCLSAIVLIMDFPCIVTILQDTTVVTVQIHNNMTYMYDSTTNHEIFYIRRLLFMVYDCQAAKPIEQHYMSVGGNTSAFLAHSDMEQITHNFLRAACSSSSSDDLQKQCNVNMFVSKLSKSRISSLLWYSPHTNKYDVRYVFRGYTLNCAITDGHAFKFTVSRTKDKVQLFPRREFVKKAFEST